MFHCLIRGCSVRDVPEGGLTLQQKFICRDDIPPEVLDSENQVCGHMHGIDALIVDQFLKIGQVYIKPLEYPVRNKHGILEQPVEVLARFSDKADIDFAKQFMEDSNRPYKLSFFYPWTN